MSSSARASQKKLAGEVEAAARRRRFRRVALFGLWAGLLLLPLRGEAQTLWAWGDNRHGQLGDGTAAPSGVPVRVSTLTGLAGVTHFAAGGGHSLALTGDGVVWAWGSNRHGQIGNAAGDGSSLPVPVSNLTGAVAVAAGLEHSLALRKDGTVWAWGGNGAGQLGDGTRADSVIPVEVSTPSGPLTEVAAIAAGGTAPSPS